MFQNQLPTDTKFQEELIAYFQEQCLFASATIKSISNLDSQVAQSARTSQKYDIGHLCLYRILYNRTKQSCGNAPLPPCSYLSFLAHTLLPF